MDDLDGIKVGDLVWGDYLRRDLNTPPQPEQTSGISCDVGDCVGPHGEFGPVPTTQCRIDQTGTSLGHRHYPTQLSFPSFPFCPEYENALTNFECFDNMSSSDNSVVDCDQGAQEEGGQDPRQVCCASPDSTCFPLTPGSVEGESLSVEEHDVDVDSQAADQRPVTVQYYGHQGVPRCRKRNRYTFSPDQVERFERIFQQDHYPRRQILHHMELDLRIPENKIRTWFQNRRAKEKRRNLKQTEGCTETRTIDDHREGLNKTPTPPKPTQSVAPQKAIPSNIMFTPTLVNNSGRAPTQMTNGMVSTPCFKPLELSLGVFPPFATNLPAQTMGHYTSPFIAGSFSLPNLDTSIGLHGQGAPQQYPYPNIAYSDTFGSGSLGRSTAASPAMCFSPINPCCVRDNAQLSSSRPPCPFQSRSEVTQSQVWPLPLIPGPLINYPAFMALPSENLVYRETGTDHQTATRQDQPYLTRGPTSSTDPCTLSGQVQKPVHDIPTGNAWTPTLETYFQSSHVQTPLGSSTTTTSTTSSRQWARDAVHGNTDVRVFDPHSRLTVSPCSPSMSYTWPTLYPGDGRCLVFGNQPVNLSTGCHNDRYHSRSPTMNSISPTGQSRTQN